MLDMELNELLRPKATTPLPLDAYWDAVAMLDKTGLVEEFLENVRRVVESGLVRRGEDRGHRWVPPTPLRRIKVLWAMILPWRPATGSGWRRSTWRELRGCIG